MALPDQFVYHRVPAGFVPPFLHPLNGLKTVHPEAYEAGAQKYANRRALMSAEIPLLGCRWNDVIHCAPIHPKHIYGALRDAGVDAEPGVSFFRIPVRLIASQPSVTLDFASRDGVSLDVKSVHWFDEKTYEELTAVPASTAEYYRREAAAGRRPLLFAHIPHVLVRACLDTSSFAVVAWDE